MTASLARKMLTAFALVLATAASAKDAKPLFASSEMLQLSLKASFGALLQGRADPELSVPGTLSTVGANPETLAVSLAARGITRRKREICQFPPLRVHFPDKPGANSVFQGQKRLKLVTHCQSSADFQQHVLLEYAAYRLFNVLTSASFKARLATITYVDDKGRPMASRYGFFIEDADDMARRNDRHELEVKARLASSQFEPAAAVRYALFQYLIGNLDWGMNAGPAGSNCCHNSRPIAAKGQTIGLIPVPYDFDYSGLVDAPYALPPAGVQVSTVRTRRYRGFCRHNAELAAGVATLQQHRDRLLAVPGEIPQLDERTRKKAEAYLAEAFAAAARPDFTEKRAKSCL